MGLQIVLAGVSEASVAHRHQNIWEVSLYPQIPGILNSRSGTGRTTME